MIKTVKHFVVFVFAIYVVLLHCYFSFVSGTGEHSNELRAAAGEAVTPSNT